MALGGGGLLSNTRKLEVWLRATSLLIFPITKNIRTKKIFKIMPINLKTYEKKYSTVPLSLKT